MSDLKKELDYQINKLVNDLSHTEVYQRKHAAWTLARLAQKGKAEKIVSAGAVSKLAKCLYDNELIVRYRVVWALSMLAKHGQKKAVLEADVEATLSNMIDDNNEVEICHPQTNEMIYTTLGNLAKEAIGYLHNES
ncbi:MAG: HEAT repeat domain-containing protein [Methanobacteriota archaeon]